MPAASRFLATALLATSATVAAPALARDAEVATRAGIVGGVAGELARQTGTSIVVSDPAVASRLVPAMRGRMAAEEAVRRLARAAKARAVAVRGCSATGERSSTKTSHAPGPDTAAGDIRKRPYRGRGLETRPHYRADAGAGIDS